MEEKERYELTDTDCILDTERNIVVSDVCDVITNADIITDLLNQQDKRTKELEQENKQLKQQLHDLPNKIVEEIRKWGQKHYNWVGDGTGYDGQDYNECIGFNMAIDQLNEILDAILEKFGGEDEINND